ncbi:MAG: TRAP transporter small permease [Burkholderiales bacterium]|jgi:TRAP-type C4-dicarboxylate transport system permease small subunit
MAHAESPAGEAAPMRAVRRLCDLALSAAGWSYLLMVAIIGFDVLARRLLGFSTEATGELTGYLLAAGMTLGLGGTLLERGHVRIDVLVQRLPLAARVWLHLGALLALLVAVGFMAFGAVSLALDSWQLGATDLSGLRTPLALPQGVWAAGFLLMGLAAVALACRSVALLLRGQRQALEAGLAARTDLDEARDTLQALGGPRP